VLVSDPFRAELVRQELQAGFEKKAEAEAYCRGQAEGSGRQPRMTTGVYRWWLLRRVVVCRGGDCSLGGVPGIRHGTRYRAESVQVVGPWSMDP
jgi:hypothetical protein